MRVPEYGKLASAQRLKTDLTNALGGLFGGRAYPAWQPTAFAGSNDAATAMQQMLAQLHEQMRNTPRRDRRPVRPNTYWQFANGKIGVPDTFIDLTEMRVYRAWDRSLGAFVTYAA